MNVNSIVFSQSTPLSQIETLIRHSSNTHPFLCISTHRLYDIEEAKISNAVQANVLFSCFADFITDEEMEQCDTNAYEIETDDNHSVLRSPQQYYDCIKVLKNQIVLWNIRKHYCLIEKYLCATDLGIASEVWFDAEFLNSVEQTQQLVNAASLTVSSKSTHNLPIVVFHKFKQVYHLLKTRRRDIYLLETTIGNYIFLGSIIRIKPRLNMVSIQPLKTSLFSDVISLVETIIFNLFDKHRKSMRARALSKRISKHISSHKVSALLSSFHEYGPDYVTIAKDLRMDLIILQDGFLPENYSSKYLAYYFEIEKFWVWDKLSLGLFDNQGYNAEVCPFFSTPSLPPIEKSPYSVKTILVLTSGAGDWTALKNRSDEDQMVIAFKEIAERFPEIRIIYRCHPLWAHPEHQGINSIKRVDCYFREKGLTNIAVSGESFVQSEKFGKSGLLGISHSSLEQDLKEADMVFGEHSYSMIDAALKGKLFVSINLTNRRNFFHNYSKLGFPHLNSVQELISFIEDIQISSTRIIERYNKAVLRYNVERTR